MVDVNAAKMSNHTDINIPRTDWLCFFLHQRPFAFLPAQAPFFSRAPFLFLVLLPQASAVPWHVRPRFASGLFVLHPYPNQISPTKEVRLELAERRQLVKEAVTELKARMGVQKAGKVLWEEHENQGEVASSALTVREQEPARDEVELVVQRL